MAAGAAVNLRSNESTTSEANKHFDIRYRLTTTSNLDDQIFGELRKYVRGLRPHWSSRDQRIALLYDDTGYGKSIGTGKFKDDTVVAFEFPSHIAELHERDSAAQNEAIQKIPHLRGFDQTIRLPNEKTLNSGGIPEVGGEMTVVNQELRLRRMLDWLAEANVDYVAITATDNRDKLYLANLIHDNLPNVRFLLTIGDLLYLHPSSMGALQGSLVASTYQVTPPFGLAHLRRADDPQTPNLVFPIQTAQSIFNATLVQLDREQYCIGLRVDLKKRPKGWSLRFDPPESVWIGVVGADRIYPVNAINTTLPVAPPEAEESTSSPETPVPFLVTKEDVARLGRRIPWNAALMAVFVAAALLIGSFLASGGGLPPKANSSSDTSSCPSPHDSRNFSVLISSAPLCLPEEEKESRFQRVNRQLSVPAVIVARLMIWNVVGFWGASLARVCTELANGEMVGITVFGFWLQSFGAAFCAGATIAETWNWPNQSTTDGEKPNKKRKKQNPEPVPEKSEAKSRHPILGLIIALVWFAVFWLGSIWVSPKPTEALDVLRYHRLDRMTNIWSGVSPIWPMAILSLIAVAWAVATLQSIAWRNRDRDTALQKLILPKTAERQTNDPSIAPGFLESSRDPRFLVVLFGTLVAVVVPVVTLMRQWKPTQDGILFDGFVFSGVVLVSYAIVVEILRMTKNWRHLESLHNRVSELPLQPAFGRFSEDFARAYGDILFPKRPRERLSPWEMQQWKTVLEKAPADVKCESLSKFLESCLNPDPAVKLPPISKQMPPEKKPTPPRLRADALKSAVALRTALESDVWPRRSSGQAFGVEKDPEGKIPACGLDWDWVRAADDLLAMTIAVTLAHYRLLLKHRAMYLVVLAFLLFLLIGSYPFTPERSLSTHAGLLVLLVLAAIGYIVTGMNRDELLSRISKTHPRLLSFDAGFIKTVLVYGGPLLVLLTSRMPIVRGTLGSWLGSAFSMLPM